MKYCVKCGKEIMDDAEICPGCGCAVDRAYKRRLTNSNLVLKKKRKKVILIVIITVIALSACIVAGFFISNLIRTAIVKNQLAGKTFSYHDYSSYPDWELYFSIDKKFGFDDEAKCTYFHTFKTNGELESSDDNYPFPYTIEFKNGKTFLVGENLPTLNTFEIQYDSYGRIKALYDILWEEKYD